jgi:hypothetical protein
MMLELISPPARARIRYTEEPALVLDSPPQSLPPYIVSRKWIGVGRGKVLIPNPEYKGKFALSQPHRTDTEVAASSSSKDPWSTQNDGVL